MDNFNQFVEKHFKISLVFFLLGLFFGLIYSINLLGLSIDSYTLFPSSMRSLHISLMLYGFVPLMLSYLPFLLINKEVGTSAKGLRYLTLYTICWYIFLIFMISSLLFGNTRGLAFYDFPYELNFILALAGVFYIFALYNFMQQYAKYPTWVRICLKIVIIAPITLLILMNPIIGQVESTVSGPHGDNTLGMSLALIPLYYLIIKLLNKEEFIARWNMLWIVPTMFYFFSVLYRIFFKPLTYEQEWFLQYLTLLYLPLLYRWYKDSSIEKYAKFALLVSICAFLFVDVQGNIIFVPEIRSLFHRNDLIVAHAHVAMGIGVFFMVVSMFTQYIKELRKMAFYVVYLCGILGIFISLSTSGFVQAGLIDSNISFFWTLRTLFGVVTITSLIFFLHIQYQLATLQKYNLMGVLSDGLGGIFLILFASYLYPMFGFAFEGKYEYVVFSFVSMTGILHFIALKNSEHEIVLTNITVIIRVFISSVFFSLFMSHSLGLEALMISLFDLSFIFTYLIFFYQKEKICQN
jgi:cytochrome c oxidase cbb3-type subunit 1